MINEKGDVVCPNCGEVNPAWDHKCPSQEVPVYPEPPKDEPQS
jgi:predicted RNA-binding Zn-ribbon protein involved in translation (DUF1610 family)